MNVPLPFEEAGVVGEECLPYAPGSATSRAAAADPRTGSKAQRDCYDILVFYKDQGPSIDDTVQIALDLPGDSQRPRRWNLIEWGYVEKSTLRGITSSGKRADCYQITAAGHAELQRNTTGTIPTFRRKSK